MLRPFEWHSSVWQPNMRLFPDGHRWPPGSLPVPQHAQAHISPCAPPSLQILSLSLPALPCVILSRASSASQLWWPRGLSVCTCDCPTRAPALSSSTPSASHRDHTTRDGTARHVPIRCDTDTRLLPCVGSRTTSAPPADTSPPSLCSCLVSRQRLHACPAEPFGCPQRGAALPLPRCPEGIPAPAPRPLPAAACVCSPPIFWGRSPPLGG